MSAEKPFIVVTSISAPNEALRLFAGEGRRQGFEFIMVGDTKSPADFALEGCDYYSVERQVETGFAFARACPTKHYARKNIGYLLALRAGATIIRDTDDDNLPLAGFWPLPDRVQEVAAAEQCGWVNVYAWFAEAFLWPRGLPLDAIRETPPAFEQLPLRRADCPIQQALADENPDVDAIYRLAFPLPQNFRADRRVALSRGTWCPFNSQNTTWFSDAFPLLYLPAYCPFRMTDIWRSFVAQRIAWENGWSVLFLEPTVRQDRNEHNLMHDFADEVPGYLHNRAIAEELDSLTLRPGREHLVDNLRLCYERICAKGWIDARELPLLDAWLADFASVTAR
jgi:hypothetical protein